MAKPATFVGLEISPTAIHAASVAVSGGLRVEHSASAALEPGVVRDGEVTDVEALAEAIRTLWRDNKELDKRVRVGIANQKIVVRVIELPRIENRSELEAAVRFSAQDEIPMPLDAAVLEFQPIDIIQTDAGPRQRVVIVAARRDMVEKVLAAVRGAGLRPEAIDLSAFGMVRALHTQTDAAEAVVYLEIGGLTNLAVAQGTTCHFTRVIGGGLEALAIELAERRALTLDEARRRLVEVGLLTPLELFDADELEAEVLADARAVLADGVRRIAGDVRNSVDFHHANGTDASVGRCVMAGPATDIPGFDTALSAELGIPVVAGRVRDAGPGHVTVAAGLAISEAVAA
jgi:type IV pilus assembly protein PilM